MNPEKKILMLGAGTWQVPWLEKAKELGFVVCATDWSSQAEGRHFAHYFEAIDLRDKEATLRYAKKMDVNAIFTSADIGVQTAAYVAVKMGLSYHSEELAYCATNKFAMREKARSINLGIPNYKLIDNIDDAKIAASQIGFPLVIKPVDSFSSRGVRVLYNHNELKNFFKKGISASFQGKVLLEEFMTGTEGSVEALVKDGVAYILGISSKQKSPLPYRYDLLLEYPGNYSAIQFERILEFTNSLVKGFGIQKGIIHAEIMVSKEDVKLIEFAIRGCGSKVITHLMPALTGYDVMNYLLWCAFGVQKEICFPESNTGLLKFIMLPKGKIKSINGKEFIKSMPGVLDFDIERKPGDVIDKIEDGRSRPGYLLACSSNKDKLNQIVEKSINMIEVEYEI